MNNEVMELQERPPSIAGVPLGYGQPVSTSFPYQMSKLKYVTEVLLGGRRAGEEKEGERDREAGQDCKEIKGCEERYYKRPTAMFSGQHYTAAC